VDEEKAGLGKLQGAKHSNTRGIASICNAADALNRLFHRRAGIVNRLLSASDLRPSAIEKALVRPRD
jgi:hypothetical protein